MCRSGAYQLPTWYNGGPSIRYLPLPIPDPERPYGGNCSECKNGECYGHFMKPDRAINATIAPMCKPPSVNLKENITAIPSMAKSFRKQLNLSVGIEFVPERFFCGFCK